MNKLSKFLCLLLSLLLLTQAPLLAMAEDAQYTHSLNLNNLMLKLPASGGSGLLKGTLTE